MTEHHFTDETATVVVLNSLIKDMSHVLSRVATACSMVTFIGIFLCLLDAYRGMWFSAAIDFCGAVAFFLAGLETFRRNRKYRTRGGAR